MQPRELSIFFFLRCFGWFGWGGKGVGGARGKGVFVSLIAFCLRTIG